MLRSVFLKYKDAFQDKNIVEKRYTDGKQAYERFSISYVIRKMKTKTMRYNYIPTRMAKIQNTGQAQILVKM